MWRFFLFALLMLALGCGKPKSVAGTWYSDKPGEKVMLQLAEDGTFVMLAGNDFAAGVMQGIYTLTGDKVTLHDKATGTVLPFAYRWIGADKLGIRADIPGSPESVYALASRGPKTASITGLGPQDEAKAKIAAEATTCLSNLKQVSTATLLYAMDYDSILPVSYTWATALLPYTKNEVLFSCPTVARAGKQGGYAMDSSVSHMNANIANPQDVVLFFESTAEVLGATDPQTSLIQKPRHKGRINFSFLDGHVKAK